MSWIKIIFFNLLIFFFIIGILLLTPPTVNYANQVYQKLKKNFTIDDRENVESSRVELKIYKNIEWANKHFSEFNDLSTKYYDYITWRRNDYNGETITVTNGIRKTINSIDDNYNNSKYFFFGGSTTWGTGVNDANTYPSIFAKKTKSKVINFGETAYIARQSLAYLNNYLIENSLLNMSDIHVVFYDGVNEVAHRCRSEIGGLGTGRENQIQDILSSSGQAKYSSRYSFTRTFDQVQGLINSIIRRLTNIKSTQRVYSCTFDAIRAREIATTLVDTWEVAAKIVEGRGGKFTAILQPVAFYGDADIEYLNLTSKNDKALSTQYKSVYPLIIEIASERNLTFVDMTDVYDGCNNCYIDFCHVGPQGHEILVSKLIKHLK